MSQSAPLGPVSQSAPLGIVSQSTSFRPVSQSAPLGPVSATLEQSPVDVFDALKFSGTPSSAVYKKKKKKKEPLDPQANWPCADSIFFSPDGDSRAVKKHRQQDFGVYGETFPIHPVW